MSKSDQIPVTELQDIQKQIRLLFAIKSHIVNNIFLELSVDELKKLSAEGSLTIPIIDPKTISRLRLCEEDDFLSLDLSIGELLGGFRVKLEIEFNDEPENHTPFNLGVYTFSFEETPGGDDGGGDDDSPVAESNTTKPLVMAVGATG